MVNPIRDGTIDAYVKYGLAHFINKYRVECNYMDYEEIYFTFYPSKSQCEAVKVKILLKSHLEATLNYIKINGDIIPIFVSPIPNEKMGEWDILGGENEGHLCTVYPDNTIDIGFNIFEEIGRHLAGVYDEYYLRDDQLGCLLRSIPTVDVLEHALFSALKLLLPYLQEGFSWPEGYKFALVLTHDVDRVYKTYQYLPSIINAAKKMNAAEIVYHLRNLLFRHGKSNPYWMFDNICELEDRLGVKSTYYFLNERGKHNPLSFQSWILYRGVYDIENEDITHLINELHQRGFEIGVHGSYNSFNNIELLRSEKAILEKVLGSKVNGVRQHYLNYDMKLTPLVHAQTGFLYDSSLGFKPGKGIGFRRGTSFPFSIMLSNQDISNVIEIPLIIMDGALDSISTVEECLRIMNEVEKYGGVLTILWHTQRFNPREYPGMTEIYEKIISEAKRKRAWITTANTVYSWVVKKEDNKTMGK